MKRLFLFPLIFSAAFLFGQKGHIDLDIKVIDDTKDSIPLSEARVRVIQNQKVVDHSSNCGVGFIQ